MAGGSLLDLGKTQMGKSGSISLKELHTVSATQTSGTTGYNRVHQNVNNDYKRVNPYMVNLGTGYARDPVPPPTAPFKLSDWGSYEQWRSNDPPIGSTRSFDITTIQNPSASNNANATFAFSTTDTAKDDFDNNSGVGEDIAFSIFARPCTNQDPPDGSGAGFGPCVDGVGEDPEVEWNPEDINFSTTWPVKANSDTSPVVVENLADDTWHIASIAVRWSDRGANLANRVSEPGLTSSITVPGGTNGTPNASSIAWGFPRPANNPGYAYEHIIFKTKEFICTQITNIIVSSVAGNCSTATATTECQGTCDSSTGNICAGDTVARGIFEVCCDLAYDSGNSLTGAAYRRDKDLCIYAQADSTCTGAKQTFTYYADESVAASSRSYIQLTSGCQTNTQGCQDYFVNSCGSGGTYPNDYCTPTGGGD